ILFIIIALSLVQCTNEEQNPVPEVLSVTPSSKVAHLPEFTIIVNGQDFVDGSVIIFDGKEKATTFISLSQLSCRISPEDTMMDIVSNNTDADEIMNMEEVVSVVVRNPAPGGGDSAQLNFTVKENFEFESPVRLFDSIVNGWAGPLIIDENDDLYLNIADAEVNKFNVKFTNFLSISGDKGDTWSDPESFVRKAELYNENLLMDEYGNIHFIYGDFSISNSSVFYKKKNKGASSWSEPVNIAGEDKSVYYNYFEHKAAIKGDKIFVFWTVYTKSYDEFLVYTFSEDNGSSWSEPIRLKDLGYVGWIDSLISEDGTLHLVYGKAIRKASWEFFVDIYTARSIDNGVTWSEPVMISNGAGRSYYPQISYSGKGENFKIFWIYKQTGQVIKNMVANLNMKKMEIIKRMSEGLSPVTDQPDQSNIVIPPSFHLRMRGSEDGGNSWETELNILDFNSDDYYFVMHFDVKTDIAGNLNLIVNEHIYFYGIASTSNHINSEIKTAYFTRSIDGGANWTTPVQFSDDPEVIAEFLNVDSEGNVYFLLNKYDFSEYFKVEPYFSRNIRN
ncbi:MAG: exo-alpha-sialidase, partial [Candidatus Aminicenantes bacterium]|nr:exo-alpha-sialidase [Candidatus Aminicenantes bacterium]